MKKTITLVGCGNVGSRHLQAIAKLPYELEVEIVEPSIDAQKLAKSRLEEIQQYNLNKSYFWHDSLEKLEKKSDLAIVATTSVGRVELIKQLLNLGFNRFLVEKVVCQSDREYEDLLSEFKKHDAKGWVNTNLRCFSSWQKIKNYFQDSKIIHLSVIASNASALGTNAIHYIDLFSFLTNNYHVKLNGEFLLNKLFPNKHGEHFKEFAGTVVGRTEEGSTVTLTFIPDTNIPNIVNIAGTDKHLMIDELGEKIFDLTEQNSHGIDFKFEHASSITTKIAKDIIEKDDCELTRLENSYFLHQEIFRVFNNHIKKITNENIKLCPIT